jgi:hypothetical protein
MKKYIYFFLLVTMIITKSYCQPEFIQVKNPDLIQTLEDTEPSLFSEARTFYDKLGQLGAADILYTSERMIGVPKGKYGVSLSVRNTVYGKPNLLWLSKVKNDEKNIKAFLVCAIYPYGKMPLKVTETEVDGWIQGQRRFDIWIMQENGSWKVKMNIDINDLTNAIISKNKDNNLLVIDEAEDAQARIKNYKQSEENISKAINEAVQKKIESEK